MSILITGGTGYIGSHTYVELVRSGDTVIIVDNLSNSKRACLDRLAAITGKPPIFYGIDLRDERRLDAVFNEHAIEAVIHFAGFKAVGESVSVPLAYYQNNINSTLVLCDVMARHGVKRLIFSSSCTVYGDPATMPITEDFALHPQNPYGRTKLMNEEILGDLCAADPEWCIALLRYFNPVGAHPSGDIGEDPNGIPNNLFPYITQVAVGRMPHVAVFGDDYDTHDGTGIRDYIHVVDLAQGHLTALQQVRRRTGVKAYNLGTGRGYSVMEVIAAFEAAIGRPIPHQIADRRPGDAAVSYADPTRAKTKLGWTCKRDLADMCNDAWRWQSANPNGYG
jgi:UDP-glucose 4-epimerase